MRRGPHLTGSQMMSVLLMSMCSTRGGRSVSGSAALRSSSFCSFASIVGPVDPQARAKRDVSAQRDEINHGCIRIVGHPDDLHRLFVLYFAYILHVRFPLAEATCKVLLATQWVAYHLCSYTTEPWTHFAIKISLGRNQMKRSRGRWKRARHPPPRSPACPLGHATLRAGHTRRQKWLL